MVIEEAVQKNKIKHNKEILREIWNKIMKENWSIITTSQNPSDNIFGYIML